MPAVELLGILLIAVAVIVAVKVASLLLRLAMVALVLGGLYLLFFASGRRLDGSARGQPAGWVVSSSDTRSRTLAQVR